MNTIKKQLHILYYTFLFFLISFSVNIQAGLYEDYIAGIIDTDEMLVINPDIISSEGPMFGNQFNNNNDLGFGFHPTRLGNIADVETQFLSFELNTLNLFDDSIMHMAISLRGNSIEPYQLFGRGITLGSVGFNGSSCNGVGIEVFGPFPNDLHRYEKIQGNIRDCVNFRFQNYSTYRIDVHVSNNWTAYWIFKRNPFFVFNGYEPTPWMGPKWRLVLSKGARNTRRDHSYIAPSGASADGDVYINGVAADIDSFIIGTAFRQSSSFRYSISNVYSAKF